MSNLVTDVLDYPNAFSLWACTPLLVPKAKRDEFCFTVDLLSINRFTVKHQYPMPNIIPQLSKLTKSCLFATFELSHGYRQFPLAAEWQGSQ